MQINVGYDGDVVILDLNGDLTASSAEELKTQVGKLTAKNFTRLMIDMSRINFMDSSGLGACMFLHKQLSEKGGIIVCAQPRDAVAKVFRITGAASKLNLASSKSEALRLIHDKITAAKGVK